MTCLRHGITALLLLLAITILAAEAPPTPLTLSEALALAQAHNPALRETAGKLDAANAIHARSRAAQQPQVRVDSRYAVTNGVAEIGPPLLLKTVELGARTNWLASLSAAQVLYSGGRLQNAARQTADMAQAATAQALRTRQFVAFETERAFLLLYAAQQGRAVATETLEAATRHLQDAEVRYDARAVPQYDVLRAQVAAQEARQGTVRADLAIVTAHTTLLRTLGAVNGNYTAVVPAEERWNKLVSTPTLVALALATRPEIQAADWQVKAADATLAAVRGERHPTLSFTGDYTIVTPETPLQLTRWTVGVFAGMPLFDGGAIAARVQEATAQREQAVAIRDALRVAVTADVTQVTARLLTAIEEENLALDSRKLAEETWRIAGVRYTEGVGTPSEVADAEATLARARQSVIRTSADKAIARAELRLAIGNAALPNPDTFGDSP